VDLAELILDNNQIYHIYEAFQIRGISFYTLLLGPPNYYLPLEGVAPKVFRDLFRLENSPNYYLPLEGVTQSADDGGVSIEMSKFYSWSRYLGKAIVEIQIGWGLWDWSGSLDSKGNWCVFMKVGWIQIFFTEGLQILIAEGRDGPISDNSTSEAVGEYSRGEPMFFTFSVDSISVVFDPNIAQKIINSWKQQSWNTDPEITRITAKKSRRFKA
jgi:hypothetical protein